MEGYRHETFNGSRLQTSLASASQESLRRSDRTDVYTRYRQTIPCKSQDEARKEHAEAYPRTGECDVQRSYRARFEEGCKPLAPEVAEGLQRVEAHGALHLRGS